MILQRDDIINALASPDPDKRLYVTPLLDRATQIGPGSIDLRLGSEFIEVSRRQEGVIDPVRTTTVPKTESYDVPLGESLILHPGHFMLGATLEFLRLPSNFAGQVLGRSSWGRLGLVVATAVTVQPGFRGCLTLELQNLGSVPMRLYPGLRIAQLTLWRAGSSVQLPYGYGSEKYQVPLGPQNSRLGWESDEVARLKQIRRRLGGYDAVDNA